MYHCGGSARHRQALRISKEEEKKGDVNRHEQKKRRKEVEKVSKRRLAQELNNDLRGEKDMNE